MAVFKQALALREALTRIFRAIARGEAVEARDLQHLQGEYLAALGQAQLAPAAGGYDWAWKVDGGVLDRPLWAVARSAVEVLTGD
jgi:predicted RNA-binding Zn ribbon-like protein